MRRHSHARLTISYSVLFYLDLFNFKKIYDISFYFPKNREYIHNENLQIEG